MSDMEDRLREIVREEMAVALAVLPKLGPEPQEYFTAREAAEYTRQTVGTLTNAVSDGRLRRCGKKGHKLIFRREDLDAYVEGGGSEGLPIK